MSDAEPHGAEDHFTLAPLGGLLCIGLLSWGHLVLDTFVETGLRPNIYMGFFSLAFAAACFAYAKLRRPLHSSIVALWVLTIAAWGAALLVQWALLHILT